MIPSPQWAREYNLKLTRFNHLYKDFLKTKVEELVTQLIITPIVEEMKLNEVSQKIWEKVEIGYIIINDDGILINIRNEYWNDDHTFDVALAREKGTADHFIRPRKKQALSWKQGGGRKFSGGHHVSGLPPLNIISRTIDKAEYELQSKLNEAFKSWRNDIFS